MLEKIKEDIDLARRHIEVLTAVAKLQPIGIIKLSEHLGLPQHRIRYSLRILEGFGYICASPTGAVVTDTGELIFSHLDEDINEIIKILMVMKQLSVQK